MSRAAAARDRAIAEIAASRHGVVTWPQLVEIGLSHRSIAHRVAVGRLFRVHTGVYLLEPPETAGRITLFAAAVSACGDRALLSHRSAAELWGLLASQRGDIDVTVIGRNPGTSRAGIRTHRAIRLVRHDVRTKHGIPLTSAARTALDAATVLEPAELERLLATARVERLATEREIQKALERCRSHPGAANLKAVLRQAGGPALTRSEAEQLLLRLIRDARLPAPETNAYLHHLEVDFLWPQQRLVVEVDGFAYHSDRAAFERDRERDAALVAAGFRVIRVTWRQLVDQPLVVVARIASALVASQT
jgi:very-short-patch-repair endonuclease/predicted transcriptional regulator of viral defense system